MRVEFFFDVVSPYSFLAATFLERHRGPWGLDLAYRPMFLGGLMKATGNQPPASLPARAPYLGRDIRRVGEALGLSLKVPDGFPHRTLFSMRCLEVARRGGRHDIVPAVASALWTDYFVDGHAPDDPDRLAAAFAAAGAEDHQAEWVAVARSGEGKAALAQSTTEAVERGAFGAPTLFVPRDDGEDMWFGSDRFELFAMEYGLPYDGLSGNSQG